MAITETDILYRLSVTTGPGDSTAQADVNASLGEFLSTTALDLVTPLNNLFADITGDESAAGVTKYRCIFVVNNHATLTLTSAVAWLSANAAGGGTFAIGLDPAGVVSRTLATAQAAETTELVAPTGVTFSAPTTKGAGLAIGNMAPDECQAIWLRYTVAAATSAADADSATLRVEGDSAA